jgi:Regulator of ribonuclease activity B
MRDDPAWSLSAHEKRNAELAALIRKKGASLEEPRIIECHFWAPSQNSADQLAMVLQARGFVKLRVNPTEQDRWNVEMAITQSVNRTVSVGFTSDLIETAAMFDGSFDGWGTSL